MSHYTNNNSNNIPMVNYTSATTSAANEAYVSQTGVADSLAFLIKNKTIYKFDLYSEPEVQEIEKQGNL